MHDFLKLILSELRGAVGAAIAAAIICVLLIFLAAGIYYRIYRGERKFPLGRAVSAALLVCWAAAILYLTVLRSPAYGGGMNLHLFRAWREAWNNFTFQNWSNVLLNVAMFVPLGVLLPLAVKLFRRPYAAMCAFLLATLSIELLQLCLSLGLFDVDDLFANFIGAAAGYGIVMTVITLLEKGEEMRVRAAGYAVLPLLTLAAIAVIFAAYYIKPYGNLSCAPAYRADVGGVSWSASCGLPEGEDTVRIYRAKSYDKEMCIAAAREFFTSIGVGEDELDISFYDNFVYISDHRRASMRIHYADGSRVIEFFRADPVSVDRSTAEELLAEYGIDIPDGATCSVGDDGSYTFELERSGARGRAGWLRVRFAEVDGNVRPGTVEDHFCDCEYVADERIISPAEAFNRMRRGDFDGGILEYISPSAAEVESYSLAFRTDTKGFLQPVWEFTVSLDGGEPYTFELPAMK